MPLKRLESLMASQHWAQARKEADRLLAADLAATDRGRVCRAGGFAALQCGDLERALSLGHEAIDLGRESGDFQTEAEAHFVVGTASLLSGEVGAAERHLLQFLDMETAASPRLPHAHFNLGVLAEQRESYRDAIAGYELALGLWLRAGQTRQVIRCYRSLAWCHLLLGEAPGAVPYLKRMEMQLRVRDDAEFRFWLLTDRSVLSRLEGDLAQSVALCEEVFAQTGAPGMLDEHLTAAAWVTGENSLDVGRLELAKVFADLALAYAMKSNWSLMIRKACDLRRRATEAEERHP
jgi:tetratricopeptide (TPR) repeat protein